MSRIGAIPFVLLLALLAACGSTVAQQPTAGTLAGGLSTAGQGAPDAAASGDPDPSGDLAVTGTSTAAGSVSSADRRGRTERQADGADVELIGGSTSETASSAPGVTPTTITIGANYIADANAVAQSFGVNNVNTQDGRTLAQIVLDDLNAHGGVLGRKLRVLWHPRDSNSQETYDQQDQAACADFTEDHKVFAAVAANARANFMSCVQKAGAAVLGGGFSTTVDTTATRYPYYVESNSLGWSRQMRSLVPALKEGGYFSPGYKLGVLSYDSPGGHEAVDKALNPALKAVGAKAEEYAYLPPNQSFSDNGPNIQQLQGIVLKFQSRGITHVLMLAVDGGLPLIFSRIADGQHYQPRYAVTSIWGGSAVASNYAAGQLHGAMGVGWFPALDFLAEDDPTVNAPMRKKCIVLFRSKGVSQQNAADLNLQLDLCQLFWFFRDALQAGGALSRDGLLAGAAKLGRRDATNTYATRFVRGHTDGAAAVQPMAYVDACTCFRRVGSLRAAA